MSEKLFESDFLTVDIKSILNKQQQVKPQENPNDAKDEQSDNAAASTNNNADEANLSWGDKLKHRLDANRKMSSEARKPEIEIEDEFFTEFFTKNWDADCAKQLLALGEPLRKALKVLGFDRQINPILGFISQEYVIEYLLKPRLLRASTFKAIYNAVAKKLIADSEFMQRNNYNIIYCQDLYNKPVKDIESYIELQSSILKVSADKYTTVIQDANRKIFFYIDTIKELDPTKRAKEIKELASSGITDIFTAKMNSLDLVKEIDRVIGSKEHTVHLDSTGQTKIASQLNSASKIFAALMSMCISTKSTKARQALSHDKFKSLSGEQIRQATQWLSEVGIMEKGQLDKADADSLVSILLGQLQNL